MFFFIGGVQPRTVDLDGQPRMCPSCGLYRAGLKRVDHYISLFFIPLFRIKKGVPFLKCESCVGLSHESGAEMFRDPDDRSFKTCPNCGKPLESRFRYCPFCGKSL
jgi:hypothetical protein